MASSIKSSEPTPTYPCPVGVNVREYVPVCLSGDNYQQWKEQMEELIKKEGLLGFINGTTKAPARKVVDGGREIENEDHKSWKRSNDLVTKWIRTTITEDINKEVKHVWTAKGLWTRFENWYGMPGNGTSSMASPSSTAPTPAVSAPPPPPTAVFAPVAAAVSTPTPTAAPTPTVSAPAAAAAAVVSTPTPTAAPTPTVSAPTSACGFANRFLPLQLHKAAIEGNWDVARKVIERESEAARAGITEYSETALIVAVKSKKRKDFVKHLLEKMSEKDVALGDSRKRTALHRAAGANNREIAELLVEMNPYLPNAQTLDKRIPLYFAAACGHRKMVLYLLSVTRDESRPMSSETSLYRLLSDNGYSPNSLTLLLSDQRTIVNDDGTRLGIEEFRWNRTPFDGESGFRILHQLTINGFYDIALALLQDKRQMALFIPETKKKETEKKEINDIEFHPLVALARKPSSFESGTSFNWLQSCIYWAVPVRLEKNADHQSTGDIENLACCCTSSGANDKAKKILWMIWKIIYLCKELVTAIFFWVVRCRKHIEEKNIEEKNIEEKKKLHYQALELVKFLCNVLCDEIANSNNSNAKKILKLALFQATSLGIVEIVVEILKSYPDAIYLVNEDNPSIFHQAIKCRHAKVFNLIHQVGESRTIFLSQSDKLKNNALHLAGKLAPQQQLNLKAGAALQMQRELQWFKEVEKLSPQRSQEERNGEGKTPTEVFTDTHKDLVKEGARWMKDTANACTIVAVLIATIVFAAAITVPGGNNSDGNPYFYKQACFIIFGISNALAFFLSVTSVLCFVSILTSHYAEHDFLVNLPTKLICGLATLFLCILSTMIAFGATLYLVFGEGSKTWIIIPILAFACIPVALFVFLKFPLIVDMIKSTFCSIFVEQKGVMLY